MIEETDVNRTLCPGLGKINIDINKISPNFTNNQMTKLNIKRKKVNN
ncbi:hypothetical protein [Colwellia demingiae]|nr:hypothetical protein [Colwellia demingiae]